MQDQIAEFSHYASYVQLISLPLEIAGLLLVLTEIFLKELIYKLESRLSMFVLAIQLNLPVLSKKRSDLKREDRGVIYREAQRLGEKIMYILQLFLTTLLFVAWMTLVGYITYYYILSFIDSVYIKLPISALVFASIAMFTMAVSTAIPRLVRYGNSDFFFELVILLGKILLFGAAILIYPFYKVVHILNILGRGRSIGGFGLVLSLLGIFGELFQVFVQCLECGPCYFDWC